jgi:hypothetical protein
MSRRFDDATRLEPCGNGRYALEVEEGDYWGVVTPHGGYLMALMLSDIWIPPIIRHPDRVAATPSLHHAVHFGSDVHGVGGESFLVRHQLTHGGEGISDEDISLWCDDGRLLLRARQLRMVVAPETMKIEGDWPGRD